MGVTSVPNSTSSIVENGRRSNRKCRREGGPARVTVALAIVLAALTVPALLINLYFTALMLDRWPRLRHGLGALFTTCGADTSSCAIVVKTPYARLFGGAPNVYVGIIWNVALLGLALRWMVTGGAGGAVAVPARSGRERAGRGLPRPRSCRRPPPAVPALNRWPRGARGGRRAPWDRMVGRLIGGDCARLVAHADGSAERKRHKGPFSEVPAPPSRTGTGRRMAPPPPDTERGGHI